MIAFRKFLLIGVALVATGGAWAADTGANATVKPATDIAGADMQKLKDQFSARRESLLADRQALLNLLKNATADQKKAIMEKVEAKQKELLDQQRALGRQIRDELRKMKQASPAGPGRR
jgi:hypothetical protein